MLKRGFKMGINEDLELKLIKEIEDRQKRIEEREEELITYIRLLSHTNKDIDEILKNLGIEIPEYDDIEKNADKTINTTILINPIVSPTPKIFDDNNE